MLPVWQPPRPPPDPPAQLTACASCPHPCPGCATMHQVRAPRSLLLVPDFHIHARVARQQLGQVHHAAHEVHRPRPAPRGVLQAGRCCAVLCARCLCGAAGRVLRAVAGRWQVSTQSSTGCKPQQKRRRAWSHVQSTAAWGGAQAFAGHSVQAVTRTQRRAGPCRAPVGAAQRTGVAAHLLRAPTRWAPPPPGPWRPPRQGGCAGGSPWRAACGRSPAPALRGGRWVHAGRRRSGGVQWRRCAGALRSRVPRRKDRAGSYCYQTLIVLQACTDLGEGWRGSDTGVPGPFRRQPRPHTRPQSARSCSSGFAAHPRTRPLTQQGGGQRGLDVRACSVEGEPAPGLEAPHL